MQCHFGALSSCDGSALFQAGNTKVVDCGGTRPGQTRVALSNCIDATSTACMLQVLAAVYGPRVVDIRSQAQHDRALVKCECAHAAFSTGTRAT